MFQDRLEHEKQSLKEAISLKDLGGSIIFEKVNCGKTSCGTCRGVHPAHGPYPYLHFYKAGTVKKRYLSNALAVLLHSYDKLELEEKLRDVEQQLKDSREIP